MEVCLRLKMRYESSAEHTFHDALCGKEHCSCQRRGKNYVLAGIQIGQRCGDLHRRFFVLFEMFIVLCNLKFLVVEMLQQSLCKKKMKTNNK